MTAIEKSAGDLEFARRVAAEDCEEGMCPKCGEFIFLSDGITKDGQVIGSCGDAFRADQWKGGAA